ncbi:hypothetical protein Q8A73_023278 [Channa argus]|nr:hypothetical protein Q8A73_023278 [Channa argus]
MEGLCHDVFLFQEYGKQKILNDHTVSAEDCVSHTNSHSTEAAVTSNQRQVQEVCKKLQQVSEKIDGEPEVKPPSEDLCPGQGTVGAVEPTTLQTNVWPPSSEQWCDVSFLSGAKGDFVRHLEGSSGDCGVISDPCWAIGLKMLCLHKEGSHPLPALFNVSVWDQAVCSPLLSSPLHVQQHPYLVRVLSRVILHILNRNTFGMALGVSWWLACLQDVEVGVNGFGCMLDATFGSSPGCEDPKQPRCLSEVKKMTSSRRHQLKSLMLQIAASWIEQEKEDIAGMKEAYIAENCPPPDLSGNQAALMEICRKLHAAIDKIDESRYDAESKVQKTDLEIEDLKLKVIELAGVKKPALKKVRMSADAMLQALLGGKHKVTMDLRANLKQVKKEVKEEPTEAVGDWRKNIEDKADRKKMFETS